METTVATVILVFLVGGIFAHDFAIDCQEHCQFCKDEVASSCRNDNVLLLDGDLCRCCDQCGTMRGEKELCKDQVEVRKDDHQVVAKVVPVKCQHGYECVSGVCVRSERSFCSVYQDGRLITYSCDNNGNFLPIECSKYHCWCINPITGVPFGNTKVPKPMQSEKISYCYYLMTINGVLDLAMPMTNKHSGLHMKSLKYQNKIDVNNIFPPKILKSLSSSMTHKTFSIKTNNFQISQNNKPLEQINEKLKTEDTEEEVKEELDQNDESLETEETEETEDGVTDEYDEPVDDEMFYQLQNEGNWLPEDNAVGNNTTIGVKKEMKTPVLQKNPAKNETIE